MEPHPDHFNSLKHNLNRFVNRGQRIGFARVAVSNFDGAGVLHQFGDAEGMENSLMDVSMESLKAMVRFVVLRVRAGIDIWSGRP